MDKIKDAAQRLGIITVEDMERYTALELIMMIANKMNEFSESLNDQNDKIQYLLGKGMLSEVEQIFNEWLEDGTFDALINQSALKKVNDRVDEVNNYNVGSVNLLNYSKYVVDDTWDIALEEALKSGKSVYIPKGSYNLTRGLYNLQKGNIIYGDGVGLTKLNFIVSEDIPYIFKYNRFSGVRDMWINFPDVYKGDCLLLDVGYVSKINGGCYHHAESYVLNNVKISFKQLSGWGTGLRIKIQNFDDNGNIHESYVRNNLVYFMPSDFEVYHGMHCIRIDGEQRGDADQVANQIWMTACSFTRIRANGCVYGLYSELRNSSGKRLLDFQDNKFIDFEVQTAQDGEFDSVSHGTVAIYIKGLPSPEWRNRFRFTQLTIWDRKTGVNGYLENAEIDIQGFMSTYVKNDANHRYGFKCVSSAVSVNHDASRYRTVSSTGNESEYKFIDGGISFINTPDGNNGYSARTDFYEEIIDGTSYSSTNIVNYDKNKSAQSHFKIGVDSKTHEAYLNFTGRDKTGIHRTLIKTGHQNMDSSSRATDKGFYALNGVWIAYERHEVVLPVQDTYKIVTLNLKTEFNHIPFLINCIPEYSDALGQTNIDIRNAHVQSTNEVEISVKHNSSKELTVVFNLVVAGCKF